MPPPRTVRPFDVIEALKGKKDALSKGCYLLVYFAPEAEKEPERVAITESRNKWEPIRLVLRELGAWTEVRLINPKGEVMHVHKRGPDDETPPGELEDLQVPIGQLRELGASNHALQMLERVMNSACHWIVAGQNAAIAKQTSMIQPFLDSQAKILEVTTRRFEEERANNASLARENVKLQHRLLDTTRAMMRATPQTATDADDERSESGEALEALVPIFLEWFKDYTAKKKPDESRPKPRSNGVKEPKEKETHG